MVVSTPAVTINLRRYSKAVEEEEEEAAPVEDKSEKVFKVGDEEVSTEELEARGSSIVKVL
jgi:hypothetical protein